MYHNFRGPRLLALLGLLGVWILALPARAAGTDQELHVLFIGNSYTYVNDLPKMIAELAKAGKQRPLRYERETPGGCSLEKHCKDGKALARIQSRKWDFVVLQEQSTAPLSKRDSMFENARKLDEAIRKQGAKTLLYSTWARQNRPDDQQAISKAYQDLGKELKAEVVPVGAAWKAAVQADTKLVLHSDDKSHPNPTGTYLAACVFYAALYGKSPEGLPGSIGKLTDEQACPLQAIAWKEVQALGK